MDINSLIAIITAIVGVVGGLITGIVTYLSAKNSIKTERERLDLEKARLGLDTTKTGTDTAAQLAQQAMQQSSMVQEAYTKELLARRACEDESSILRLGIENLRVFRQTLITKLHTLMDMHDKKKPIVPPCPAYDEIQFELMSLLEIAERQQ